MIDRIENTNKFDANGKTYFIESEITVGRLAKYRMYSIEAQINMDIPSIINKVAKVKEALDKVKFVDSAVMIEDLMRGFSMTQDETFDPILKLCALFINTENEDRSDITDDQIAVKIKDWVNISYKDFMLIFKAIIGIE